MAVLAMAGALVLGACGDDDDDVDFRATLVGSAERPTPVTTPATATFTLEDNGTTMDFVLTLTGTAIVGPITGAHIHAIPRSAAAPADTTGAIVVNLSPTAGVTTGILAQGVINAASISSLGGGAAPISMDSLRTLMIAGRTYVNVHTQANPGGHIRGTIVRD
jgi:hypothetical protein